MLDPTNEKVYELFDGFPGEMAALFPDACVQIGGDENNGKFVLLDGTKSLPVAVTPSIVPVLKPLVSAAAEQSLRPTLTRGEWRLHRHDRAVDPPRIPAPRLP